MEQPAKSSDDFCLNFQPSWRLMTLAVFKALPLFAIAVAVTAAMYLKREDILHSIPDLIWYRMQDPEHTVEVASNVITALLMLLPILIITNTSYRIMSTKYELTSQYLRLQRGILSIKHDPIDLRTIRDMSSEYPFLLRILRLGNIVVYANDHTTPVLRLTGLSDCQNIYEKLRSAYYAKSVQQGVFVHR